MVDIDYNTEAEHFPLVEPGRLSHNHPLSENGAKARKLINKYALIAGSTGLLPFATITDQVAVAGLLLKLLRDLCATYGVSFNDQQGKILIAAILGGAHAGWVSHYLIRFLRDYTPVLPASGALILRPAVSGLLVYYIGKLFLVHLESGAWHATANRRAIGKRYYQSLKNRA
ncbi:hypothetical protein [Methylomonas sp. MgM2]